MEAHPLDSPERAPELAALLAKKQSLRKLYLEIYGKYAECLGRCPPKGKAIELGSGAGFVKEVIPEMVTTDLIAYPSVDQVVDATAMPFPDGSLRGIFMLNVFHHIPDVEGFFREALRCLVPGGRVLIVDQNRGWLSAPILKYVHHEPYRPEATEWKFDSEGPLSGANGALAWIVFQRDLARFNALFPGLALERYEPHTPLRYWLSGGLKSWSLLPAAGFGLATALDGLLIDLSEHLGSFVDVELVKRG